MVDADYPVNEPGGSLCRESRVPSIAVHDKYWEGNPKILLIVPPDISLFSCSAVNDLSMIVGQFIRA